MFAVVQSMSSMKPICPVSTDLGKLHPPSPSLCKTAEYSAEKLPPAPLLPWRHPPRWRWRSDSVNVCKLGHFRHQEAPSQSENAARKREPPTPNMEGPFSFVADTALMGFCLAPLAVHSLHHRTVVRPTQHRDQTLICHVTHTYAVPTT